MKIRLGMTLYGHLPEGHLDFLVDVNWVSLFLGELRVVLLLSHGLLVRFADPPPG